MSKTPANWFYYFDEKVKGIVTCKAEKCDYTKTLNKSRSTFPLSTHLQNHHPQLFKQREEYISKQKAQKEKSLHSNPLKRSFANAFSEPCSSTDVPPPDINENIPEPSPIVLSLKAKRPWDADGPSTLRANRALMEFLATSAKPFKLVENAQFRKFCQVLQPNYSPPGRKHFSQYELSELHNEIKSKLIHELEAVEYCSLTTDGWTSKDNKHSIISLTCHFLDAKFRPDFRIIGAKPIKGRHTADAIISLLKSNISEYGITNKIFSITRDTENTMKKCVKDGLRLYNAEDSFDNLIERVKKFIRKVRKVFQQNLSKFNRSKIYPLLL